MSRAIRCGIINAARVCSSTPPAEDAPNAYLRVIGIDALAEELRTRGADIVDGPEDRSYGQRELVVKDCNGLILCFGQDTTERST